MTITDRSRERVEAALARLREHHGVERVVEHRWTLPEWAYDRDRRRFEAGTVGGAGAWVLGRDGRALLVREEPDGPWSEPSGKQEPGETLAQAARREVREETGASVALTGVELAQTVATTDGDRPPLWRLIVLFGGRYVGGELRPAAGEIAEVDWFERRPDALAYEELQRMAIPAGGE